MGGVALRGGGGRIGEKGVPRGRRETEMDEREGKEGRAQIWKWDVSVKEGARVFFKKSLTRADSTGEHVLRAACTPETKGKKEGSRGSGKADVQCTGVRLKYSAALMLNIAFKRKKKQTAAFKAAPVPCLWYESHNPQESILQQFNPSSKETS